MKKFYLFLCYILTSSLGYAYDFESDGFYYNLLSVNSVELTVGENKYSGELIIPSIVHYMNKDFSVEKIASYSLTSSDITGVVLPNTLTYIGEHAFQYSNIQSIVIPASVTRIGNDCFYNSKINSITFEASDESLSFSYQGAGSSRGIFVGCNELKNVYINRNIRYFSDHPNLSRKPEYMSIFTSCPIEHIYLGANVTYISNAFHYCDSLKDISIPTNIEKIYAYAFLGCSNLKTIYFSAGLKSVGEYAFKGCTSLKELIFREGIQTLSYNSFENCISLESLYLPSTISVIGNSAFLGCRNISKIYSNNNFPNTITTDAFDPLTFLTATLYVPVGAKERYERAEGWNQFSQIIETDNFDISSEMHTVLLSVSKGGKVVCGSIEISNNSYSWAVKDNESLSLQIISDDGYFLKSVEVNNEDVTRDVKDGFLQIDNIVSDKQVYINFEKEETHLSIKDADLGCVSLIAENGKSYSFVITPSEGWDIESVSFNGENVTYLLDGNKYTTPVITTDSELNIVYRQIDLGDVKTLKNEGNVKVFVSYGKLTIENAGKFTNISVYTTSGTIVANESAETGTTTIELPTYNIYIVKVGEQTFKVSM